MELKIYSIYDSAVKSYARPFFVQTRMAAIRAVTDMLKQDKHVSDHVTDYSLFEIGDYDDETGALTGKYPEKVIGLWELQEGEKNAAIRSHVRNGTTSEATEKHVQQDA